MRADCITIKSGGNALKLHVETVELADYFPLGTNFSYTHISLRLFSFKINKSHKEDFL